MTEDNITVDNTEELETGSVVAETEQHRHVPGIACPVCGNMTDGVGHDRSMGRLAVAMVGAIFIANSYLLSYFFPERLFAWQLSAIVGSLILATPIFITAVKDICTGRIYMNELVALAILAAFSGDDFRTAGIISFFLLLTIIIETRTASGAQRSIEELIKLTPNTARKVSEGVENEIDVTELLIGDIVSVRPGENFPIDGKIISGNTTVNQASITGESLPVDKSSGDDVYAGTQNLTGRLEIEVTKLGEDTTLGKVKEMIIAAENSRTPFVRAIDKYAGYYTPTVLMIAGLTWWFSEGDMNRVITLMVIACPCAIVLATPSAVIAAVAAAARVGILIKNVSHLELASKIRTFVFDKTGTLTEGILSVARLNPAEGVEPADLLYCAASIESHSNHPTAKALQKLAGEATLELGTVIDFTETHGKGVEGTIGSDKYCVGRGAWLDSLGIDITSMHTGENENEDWGMSVVYVSKNGKVLGWIGFKDKIRDEASEIIATLKSYGIKRCAMVTGDRESVAETVAAAIGLEEFRSECLPETKVKFVEDAKKGSTVAVVGDGVNDAPALSAGDLGIAMGAIGSDIAINSASIALMTNDLRRIPLLVNLSKKSTVIINQNLFMSLLFVLGGMTLSVFGMLTPVMAAVLHTLSTLVILFNSARLVRTGESLSLSA